MQPWSSMLLHFSRDFLLVLFSTVAVCSTMLISSVETLLQLLRSSKATTAPGEFSTSTGLLVFYYITLGFFLCVCLFVLGSFFSRMIIEFTALRFGSRLNSGRFFFSVKLLRYSLWIAFFLLAGLFCAYWAFWGKLLNTLSWRMQIVIRRLSEGNEAAPPEAMKALGDAANRTFIVVVFFVLSISFNVLALMRALINKTILLRMNNRASLFRLQHVDLADIVKTENTSRWLWMSFAFDVAELWTLATWSLYPIFVAVFWIEESSCIGSDLVVSTASLSPLIGCMFAARYHLLIVCVGWMGVTSATALMYFLRVLDERRYLKGSSNARWWNLGPFVLVTCAMVWIGLAAAILSLVMMGKPFFSSAVNADDKIYLAAPGIVLFCGNSLLLFHLAKKLVAAFKLRTVPKVSFFFERGVKVFEGPMDAQEVDSDGEYEMDVPYMAADDILF